MIPPELHRYQFILLCAENIPNHVRTEHSCLVSGHDVPAVSVIVVSSSIAYQRNIPFTEHHGSHEDVDYQQGDRAFYINVEIQNAREPAPFQGRPLPVSFWSSQALNPSRRILGHFIPAQTGQ